ncbi:hypothetical protein CJF30_00011235 [Rutstroemia sp. NJR-2017a BBW]|nr:hypothetical protein CJF30_00011235 [Rutstroemia sp. NJR-2017a BBW]
MSSSSTGRWCSSLSTTSPWPTSIPPRSFRASCRRRWGS